VEHEVPLRVLARRIYAEEDTSTHRMSRRQSLPPPMLSSASTTRPSSPSSSSSYATHAAAALSRTSRRGASASVSAIPRSTIADHAQREQVGAREDDGEVRR
jgi:hypothetical protein